MTRADWTAKVDTSCVTPTRVWVVLLLLTFTVAVFSEAGYRGPGFGALLLCVAFAKGTLIADHFMGLRRVRSLWRTIVLGYLLVVVIGIGVAYRLSMT